MSEILQDLSFIEECFQRGICLPKSEPWENFLLDEKGSLSTLNSMKGRY